MTLLVVGPASLGAFHQEDEIHPGGAVYVPECVILSFASSRDILPLQQESGLSTLLCLIELPRQRHLQAPCSVLVIRQVNKVDHVIG